VHGNALHRAWLFSRIAASKLRRDLPARRTKGYKAFANDMIRELFRVPHPRHIRASARLQAGLKITIPKNLTFSFVFICILPFYSFVKYPDF